jgi:hypothetical protein
MLSIFEYLFTGKSRLRKEINDARLDLDKISENLVDWNKDELELLSLIQDSRKMRSAFSSSVEGIICSIYHEHMISYLWTKVQGFGNFSIIVANTSKYKFDFIIKQNLCSFYVNDQYLGDFKSDNKLYLSKNRTLAYMKSSSSSEWWAIHVENEFVGSLVNLKMARKVNPRALQLKRNLTEIQEAVILSIAIYKIVEFTRKMKKIPFE